MTYLRPVALRRAATPTPHPTAQYWSKCQVEGLFNQPVSILTPAPCSYPPCYP